MDDEGYSLGVKPLKSKLLPIGVVSSGFLASVIQPVILLLSGKDVNDAVWPHAFRALQATMWLRSNLTLMFFFVLLMLFSSLVALNNRFKGKELGEIHQSILLFVIGLFKKHYFW